MELQRSASHLALPYEENRMLSESCTQTDSLSIPTTFDLGTQTDESVSPHHLENSTAGFVTDASDTLNVSTFVLLYTLVSNCNTFPLSKRWKMTDVHYTFFRSILFQGR